MTPKEIEAASFRNLVEQYREELTRVMNGELVTVIFTNNCHGLLKRHGVLHRVPNSRRSGLTHRAMEILNRHSSESLTTEEKKI